MTNGIHSDSELSGVSVKNQPPDVLITQTPQDTLNIFLYHVSPNQGYRNSDQPTRNSNGDIVMTPRLGLNLQYMITAIAAGNDDVQAHKILASAMRTLHETPVLTRDMISQTISSQSSLSASDLAEQPELVKVAPKGLTLEETSKLWSSFFQTNYRISAMYEATVVLLDSTYETRPPLPVVTPQLTTLQFLVPSIAQVQPTVLPYDPTKSLTILGTNLAGSSDVEGVSVRIGEGSASPSPANLSNTQIVIPLSSIVVPGSVGFGGSSPTPTSGTTYIANEPIYVTITGGAGVSITTSPAGGVDGAASISNVLLDVDDELIVVYTGAPAISVNAPLPNPFGGVSIGLIASGGSASPTSGTTYIANEPIYVSISGGTGVSITTVIGSTTARGQVSLSNVLMNIGDAISVTYNPGGAPTVTVTTQVQQPFADNTITAGVKTVQVVQSLNLPSPGGTTPHAGFQSNIVPFVLAPTFTSTLPRAVTRGGSMTVKFQPAVGPLQDVSFIFGVYEVPAPELDPTSNPVDSLTFQIPTQVKAGMNMVPFPTGTFLFRMRVDDADSPTTAPYTPPMVTVS